MRTDKEQCYESMTAAPLVCRNALPPVHDSRTQMDGDGANAFKYRGSALSSQTQQSTQEMVQCMERTALSDDKHCLQNHASAHANGWGRSNACKYRSGALITVNTLPQESIGDWCCAWSAALGDVSLHPWFIHTRTWTDEDCANAFKYRTGPSAQCLRKANRRDGAH